MHPAARGRDSGMRVLAAVPCPSLPFLSAAEGLEVQPSVGAPLLPFFLEPGTSQPSYIFTFLRLLLCLCASVQVDFTFISEEMC